MKVMAAVLAPVTQGVSVVINILTVALVYPLLVLSIWFVNDSAFVSGIFDTMFDGTITGFVAANLMVFGLGLVCMFFGVPLRLFGVI